jgi:hypothetical protein
LVIFCLIHFLDDLGITETGIPIVTCNTGESYSFDSKMKSWICIADSHTPFSPFISSMLNDSQSDYSLNAIKKRAFNIHASLQGSSRSQESRETIEDLELGMQSSESLKDEKEYERYAKAYAKLISQNNDLNRLNHLCSNLLFSRRNLLKEVLYILTPNTSLQRIVFQYKSILEELDMK